MPCLSFAKFPSSHARIAAVFVTAALLLSGCQGSSTPSDSPTATGSTTASPTSSATTPVSPTPPAPAVYKPADAKGKAQNVPVPVMPELAKENSKAGLEAFIGYYYAFKNYANETGDIAVLATLSTPECRLCSHMQTATTDSYKNGRWMAGGALRVPNIEIDWQTDQASHAARAQVIQDAMTYYNADGTEGRPADAASNDVFVLVALFQTNWKVVDTGVIR